MTSAKKTTRPRFWRRHLRLLLLPLALILGTALVLVFWGLHTQAGAGWALRQAGDVVPGLSISDHQGSISGGLQWHGMSYHGDGLDLRIAHGELKLDVDWLPRPKVQILYLRANDIDVEIGPAEPASPVIVLPDLSSPLPVSLDELSLMNIKVMDAGTDTTVEIAGINGRAQYAETLVIKELNIDSINSPWLMGGVRLQADSELSPPYSHRLKLDGQVVRIQEYTLTQALALSSESRGSVDEINATITAAGDSWLDALSINLNASQLRRQAQLDGRLRVQQLHWPPESHTLAMTQINASLSGALNALKLDAQWRQDLPGAAAGSWRVQVQQQEQTWLLDQLSADLAVAAITARGRANTEKQSLELDVAVERLQARELSPALEPVGSWDGALHVLLADRQITLHDSQWQRQDGPGALQINGHYQLDAEQFQLQTQWRNLQWLTDTQSIASASGDLELGGRLDAYQLSGAFDFVAGELPPGRLNLTGSGNQESFKLSDFSGDWLAGTILANGEVNWSSGLRWSAELSAEQINPAGLYAPLEGQIDLAIRADGQQQGPSRQIYLEVQKIDGELQGKPIGGHGELRYHDGVLDTTGFQITAQGATLTLLPVPAAEVNSAPTGLSGRKTPQSLDWRLSIPDATQLLPAARGQLSAAGRARFDGAGMTSTFTVETDRLRYPPWRLDKSTLSGEGYWRLAEDKALAQSAATQSGPAWQLALNGQLETLQWSEQPAIDQVVLDLKAAPDEQQVNLLARNDDGELSLDLHGDYLHLSRSDFIGALQGLTINHRQMGDWALQQETPLRLEAGEPNLAEPVCLESPQNSSRICVETRDLDSGAGRGLRLRIDALPLALLNPFLGGPQISGSMLSATISGGLGEQADVDPGESIYQLDIEAAISAGALRIAPAAEPFHVAEVRLHASTNEQQDGRQSLVTDFLAKLDGGGGVNSQLTVHEWTQADQAHLDGELVIAWEDLAPLQKLLPDIDRLGGAVDGRWQITGPLNRPQLNGLAVLRQGRWAHAMSGLRIREANFSVHSQHGQALQIAGGMLVGEGQARLEGSIDFNAPAIQLQVAGQNLTLMDGADGHLLADPELDFQWRPERIDINGRVHIPQARLQPAAGNNVAQVSPDVYVAGAQSSEVKGPVVMGKLTVSLGDKVEVKAAAANTDIDGALDLEWQGDPIPLASGELRLEDGSVRAYGQNLEITRGLVLFEGGTAADPRLDIRATRTIFGDPRVKAAGVAISGSANNPRVSLYTDPSTNEEKALTYLVTGSNFDHANGEGALSLGIYLLPKLLVSYGFGLFENGNVASARYELSDHWSVQAQSGARDTGADITWSIDK